jgi:nickel-dependent lactate racemase
MKLTMAILAAALYVTANSTIVRADPQSVEATEDAAKAEYRAAKAKCRSMKGSEKDGCLKQAKAHYTAAVEGAKAETKTAQADAEATEHKMETDYMFAKEKCDPLSGRAKSACIAEAKAQYQH